MSGDAQSGSAFRLLPAVFCKLKNPCQAHRLRGGIVCGEALGMMCHGALGVPARSVLHLQKDRCLEGTGKAALELDAACPSLTRFQFHVYSNASCGRQFQSRADFSALTKSSEDFETAEALRLELPRAPSTKILHLKLPRTLHLESHIRNRLTPLNQESLTCRLNLLCFIEISFPLVLK